MASDDEQRWVDAYRAELVVMDSLSLSSGSGSREWNAHVNKMQRAQLELRKTPGGRAAITAMISDAVPTVAHWSAAHALFWSEPEVRAHLQAIAGTGGLHAFEATTLLREFDAGRLRMDWEPTTP